MMVDHVAILCEIINTKGTNNLSNVINKEKLGMVSTISEPYGNVSSSLLLIMNPYPLLLCKE